MITATREKRSLRKQPTQGLHIADGDTGIDVSSYFRWKGIVEWVIAAVLLVVALPFMCVLTVVVRLSSSGPAVFRQVRVGRAGRLFTMYKYRTMMHGAEAKTGPIWATTDDPRLTRIGRIIRKMHLDELPQLWNVVRGDMALVGPRPERPEFTHSLAKEISGYSNRLAVLPGITGLAQINLPADSDLNSVRRKLVLDLEYIRQASFSIDFRLLLCTCFRAVGFSGYQASRILSIRREVHMPESSANSASAAPQVAHPVGVISERQRGEVHAHVAELATATHRPR